LTRINSTLNTAMQRDAARLLYGNGLSGILITLVASSFLVFAYQDPSITPFKKTWWLVMATLLFFRLIDLLKWELKLKNTEFEPQRNIMHFVIGANVTAIMWSIYLVYCVTQIKGVDIELTTTIITVASLAGGSATVLAAHKYTAVFYPFLLLGPGSICLLLTGDKQHYLLGVLGLFFTLLMLLVSRKSADFTLHTLFLKNENFLLVQTMEEKVKQRTQKVYELSNLDPLTQLYNRAAFLEQLKQKIIDSKTPFALLFIDLDGFKKINDSIGHKAGDDVITETAKRLNEFTSNSELLCRWGGDEFLIVLSEVDEAHARDKSQKLISLLSKPHNIENSVLSVGATIGIALYPKHAMTENRLIQLADMAMYQQKKQMRSKVCVFDKEMESLLAYDLHLKNALTRAIENQELRLVFQPIISSKTLKPTAFEALLRWRHNGQNIPPDEFIPIAEQYGLIHEIGAWVLLHACVQAKRWHTVENIVACVNVSVIQLQDDNFINMVNETLSNSLLPPERLHIEITESVFASDLVNITNQIKSLQAMGIKVSIDDFGTGYSSLSAMQDLAVNMVKIDRSFVNKIDSNGHAIISAVMHMSSALNFTVVAEGIETQEQSEALLRLGVHYFQGFYFSKPLEINNIPSYLENT